MSNQNNTNTTEELDFHTFVDNKMSSSKVAVRVNTTMAQRTVSIAEAAQIVGNATGATGKFSIEIIPEKFENWVENSYNGIRDVFKIIGNADVYVSGKEATYVMDIADFEEALPKALADRKEMFKAIATEISGNWDEFAEKCVKKMGSLDKRNKKGRRYFKYDSAKEYFQGFKCDIIPVPLPVEATVNENLSEFAKEWMRKVNKQTRSDMFYVPIHSLVEELDKFIDMLQDTTRQRYQKDTFNQLDAALNHCFSKCKDVPAIQDIHAGFKYKGKVMIHIRGNLDKLIASPEKLKIESNRKKMGGLCTIVRDKILDEVINA